MLENLARETKTTMSCDWQFIRDAFHLDQADPLVAAFQGSYWQISGRHLPAGPKPFVDDGNCFWGMKQIPAITHGPRARGQHTVAEWVDIDDLERVALLYAATAVAYCPLANGTNRSRPE